MEVLHAVFHLALVRANFIVAALHQRFAAGVHAQRNLVVFDAGFHVGRLLRFDVLALEGVDFFGVEELDDAGHLAQAVLEKCLLFALVQRFVEVGLDAQLRSAEDEFVAPMLRSDMVSNE
jgi:hypothetical protein